MAAEEGMVCAVKRVPPGGWGGIIRARPGIVQPQQCLNLARRLQMITGPEQAKTRLHIEGDWGHKRASAPYPLLPGVDRDGTHTPRGWCQWGMKNSGVSSSIMTGRPMVSTHISGWRNTYISSHPRTLNPLSVRPRCEKCSLSYHHVPVPPEP